MGKLFLSLLLSGGLLAAVALAAAYGLATAQPSLLLAQQVSLRAEASLLAATIGQWSLELAQRTAQIASEPTLGADIAALDAVLARPANPKNKAAQLHAENLRVILKQRIAGLKRRFTDLGSVAFITLEGLVVSADSPHFSTGDNVRMPREGGVRPEVVLRALGGAGQMGLHVRDKTVWLSCAEPVYGKGKWVGLLVLEAPLRRLPATQAAAFLRVEEAGNVAVLGQAPPGVPRGDAKSFKPAHISLLAGRAVQGKLSELDFGLAPLFVDALDIGVWGATFSVPHVEQARGIVHADFSNDYRDLAERQLQIFILAAVVWLLHALLFVFAGWRRAFRRGALAGDADHTPGASADVPQADGGIGANGPIQADAAANEPLGGAPSVDAADDLARSLATAAVPSQTPEERLDLTELRIGDLLDHLAPDAATPPEVSRPALFEALGLGTKSAAQWQDIQATDLGTPFSETAPPLRPAAAPPAVTPASPPLGPPMSARDQLMAKLQSKPSKAKRDPTEPPGVALGSLLPEQLPPPIEADPAPPTDPRATRDRAVFDEFVRLRKQCGEAGELPYDKFVSRLADTRTAVMAKTQCADVVFAAYVKNGKAALKATPA